MKRIIRRHEEFGTATVIENPKGSAIFTKSPLRHLADDNMSKLTHVDQCAHDAKLLDDAAGKLLPVRKATSLLHLDIELPKTAKTCPGREAHPKHAALLSGVSGFLAVLPWRMAVALVEDITAHAKQTTNNLHVLAEECFDTFWKCARCTYLCQGLQIWQEYESSRRRNSMRW